MRGVLVVNTREMLEVVEHQGDMWKSRIMRQVHTYVIQITSTDLI